MTGSREPSVVYLSDAVSRLERAVARIGSLRLRPWHMTLSGYAAMRVLEGQPDLSLAQVSRRCYVTPQTMTRIIADLERRGWVCRAPHAESERAISLSLTVEGAKNVAEMAAVVDRIEETIAAEIEGDPARLAEELRRCAARVEAEAREV